MSDNTQDRTPWYASIVTRATVVFTLLLAAAVIITGWLAFRDSRDQLVARSRADMRHTLDLVSARTSGFARTLDEDIAFLADNAPVRALCARADTMDTAGFTGDRERVALLLESFIRSRGMYAQVRVIGADSAGRELLRWDQNDGRTTRVADSLLQPKGDRDYYRTTMRLRAGEHWFSTIDLNKEHGHVSRPLMPTLRVAAPLFTPRGARAGIVIINADLRLLFAELQAMAPNGTALMLANARGELLLHPDTSHAFRFEFGGSSTLAHALATNTSGDTLMTARSDLAIGPTRERYTIAVAQPTIGLLQALREKSDALWRTVALIVGSALLLAVLFALTLRARLDALARRVERYSVGEKVDLPMDRRDETGRLARGLQRMQERIDARVEELEKARAQAEDSDRQRRELLANMSHEVRTPLNAIIGMSSDIDMAMLSAADREKLGIVRRSAHRLKGLVEDLLTEARISEGRLALRIVDFDPHSLIADVVRAHETTANAKGITLGAHADGLPATLRSDPLRVHQVLDNLVGNAVRFTVRGGVRIDADMVGHRLRIAVEDSGPGIPENERQRVFQRFERASTSEHDAQGAGLGLAITKRIVDVMGGSIAIGESASGGARFTVELPVETGSEGDTSRGAQAIDGSMTAGLKVLYVEDVATNRMLMEQWAARWGWALANARDGNEAIAACEKETFDLLLIDLDLGEGMSGMELALRLRGAKRHRYAPMIAVTAFADPARTDEALKTGMNDLVTKPIDRDALLATCAFWSGRSVGIDAPDTNALAAQYDNDREALLKVYQQYRKEFALRRAELRDAVARHDGAVLAATRHKLRPHWLLLGLNDALIALDALTANATEQGIERVEEAFKACDHALMRAQRELLAATAA